MVMAFMLIDVEFWELSFCFFKQKTAYEMRIGDWSSDVCSSDLYDEKAGTIDVQGWVTLSNNTGTTFDEAKTLLVAGTPSTSGANSRPYRPRPQPPGDLRRAGTETAPREQLGDYYLYPLAERTTIANAQTKQVSFLDVSGVPAQKIYEFAVGGFDTMTEPASAASVIKFNTSAKGGGLGDALPAGTVRFYQRDMRGDPPFSGEKRIRHTPMGRQHGPAPRLEEEREPRGGRDGP